MNGTETPIESRRPLAKPAEVAEYLGTTVGNLAQMRYAGTGPVFTRTGPKSVRYDWRDADAYVAANKFSQTGTQPIRATA